MLVRANDFSAPIRENGLTVETAFFRKKRCGCFPTTKAHTKAWTWQRPHTPSSKVAPAGGRGGIIALGRHGCMVTPHSTEGLFWVLARAHRPVKTNACHWVVE